MKSTRTPLLSFIVAFCSPFPVSVHAGTVITTNLPDGTNIVNIDSRADGSAAFSGDSFQSFWYQPTATAPSLTLPAGTYEFRIINPVDAASFYPGLTGAQLSQIFTAWTYNVPWTENYLVFNSTALANIDENQLFDGALAPGSPVLNTFASATDAYNGTIANGYYNRIRPAPPGRDGTAGDYRTQYTFDAPANVLFVIPDHILSDNTGGVSVVVTAVPEPSAAVLCGGGIILLLTHMRRRTVA